MFGFAEPAEILAIADCRVLFAPEELDRIAAYNAERKRGGAAPGFYAVKGRKKDGIADRAGEPGLLDPVGGAASDAGDSESYRAPGASGAPPYRGERSEICVGEKLLAFGSG
jgi:hypothetical protein